MTTDVLVIGCGIAGATAALRLARNERRRVTVLCASHDPLASNTAHAQGGIVFVEEDDSALVDDIVRASGHTASPRAASILAGQGGRLLREVLMATAPVPFDRHADGRIHLGLEGGHARRRVAHVADGTGRAIARALLDAIARTPNIELVTGTTALELDVDVRGSGARRCRGATVLGDDGTRSIAARATVIATGGLAANYLHTTNPRSARGDGIAMAARAGARTAGLEYVQFHPTALAIDGADNFLISEAVRGEGAVLLSHDGREFMRAYAPEWRDLAPRDVVARAINEQMLMHGTDHVLLDLSSRMSAERILRRFPAIAECCLLHGIDITQDAIPVRPAAHYTCGGIVVDAFGRTTLAGLYAIGEASNTGLHGANRLASTSLLEGLVWGSTAADDIEAHLASTTHDGASSASSQSSDGTDEPDRALIALRHEQLRDAMWTGVGLIRTRASLERAIERLVAMHAETVASMSAWRPDAGASGLRNAIEASMLVARAAHRRRESSGCHWRADGVVAAV